MPGVRSLSQWLGNRVPGSEAYQAIPKGSNPAGQALQTGRDLRALRHYEVVAALPARIFWIVFHDVAVKDCEDLYNGHTASHVAQNRAF